MNRYSKSGKLKLNTIYIKNKKGESLMIKYDMIPYGCTVLFANEKEKQ